MTQATDQLTAPWRSLIDQFIEQRRRDGLRPVTIADAARVLDRLERWTQTPVEAITEQQLLDWQAAYAAWLAPTTLTTRCSHIRSFYRWAVIEGHVEADPSEVLAPAVQEGRDRLTGYWLPRPQSSWPRRDRLTPVWQQLIDAFLVAETEWGTSALQVRHHRLHVAVFAEYVGDDPSTVTRPQVLAWLDPGETSSGRERNKRAQSLRIFFGWAKAQGHISGNPASQLGVVRAPLGGPQSRPPEPWAQPLVEWTKFMRSESKPDTTIGLRLYHLRRFAMDHPNHTPWAVTLDDLAAWLGSFTWAPETRRSYRGSLCAFYHWGHITGRIPANPTALLPAVRPPDAESHPAPEEYFRAALRQASQRVRLMVELAGFVGMRRAEIAVAHRDDVQPDDVQPDLEAWSILVHGKGRRERMVPLLPGVALELRAMPAGFLFPGQIDGHLSAQHVGKLISAVLPDGWAAHSLRHRFSNKFYEAERDIRALQKALGHASVATTERYTRVPADAIRRGIGNVG